MKVVVTGSRDYPRPSIVREVIKGLPADTTVIVGGAKGRNRERSVDWVAEQAAREAGLNVIVKLPDWDPGPETRITKTRQFDGKLYDVEAGNRRNVEMLEMLDAQEDAVLALWDGKSPGTRHCIREANMRALEIRFWDRHGVGT